jgi:hypothetical protein
MLFNHTTSSSPSYPPLPRRNLSPLCSICRGINFTEYAWRNQYKLVESFPGSSSLRHFGCGMADNYMFTESRPKLGTISDLFTRESCALCSIISKKLRELGLLGEGRCSIQCVKFCSSDTEPNGLPVLIQEAEEQDNWIQGYGYGLREENRRPTEYTTTRLAVLVELKGWSHSRVVVLFQPTTTKIPTVEDTVTAPNPSFSGRLLDPDTVSIGLLKLWLNRCEVQHGRPCRFHPWTENLKYASDLRLIDVNGYRVIKAPSSCRYTALSYVWAGATATDLPRRTFLTLSRKGVCEE